jgi:hypothetical protein
MKIVLAALAWVFICGCLNSDEKSEVESDIFGDARHLDGKVVIESNKLIDPWVILYMDSLLVIGNKKGTPVIELYTPTGGMVSKVIERGSDSTEIRFVGSLQANYSDSAIYIYDLFRKKTLRIPINKWNVNYKCFIEMEFTKLPIPIANYDKVYINHGGFIAESRSPQGRILLLDRSGRHERYLLDYPAKVDSTLTERENAQLYPSGIAISPNQQKVAVAAYDAGILNLLSLEHDTALQSIWTKTDFLPEGLIRVPTSDTSHIAFSGNSRSGYADVAATNDYVYAIYSGKYFRSKNYSFSNTVRVTSWDGKIHKKLVLDKDINRLTVTPDNSIMYGIALSKEGKPEIVSYNLKNIF